MSGGERGVYKSEDGGVTWTESLRVSDENEATGLDLSQHSETAYGLGE